MNLSVDGNAATSSSSKRPDTRIERAPPKWRYRPRTWAYGPPGANAEISSAREVVLLRKISACEPSRSKSVFASSMSSINRTCGRVAYVRSDAPRRTLGARTADQRNIIVENSGGRRSRVTLLHLPQHYTPRAWRGHAAGRARGGHVRIYSQLIVALSRFFYVLIMLS